MKRNQKTVIILISLLIITGSATSVFQAYARRTFQIDVTLDPANGGTVTGNLQVHNNQDATVTISPKPGYRFDSVTKDTEDFTIVDSRAPIEISFTKVKSDHTIYVTFIVDVLAQFEPGSTATTSELVLATDDDLPDLLPPLSAVTPYYQVEITEGEFSGLIAITVFLPEGVDSSTLRLYIGNPVDFDNNGTINGNDVALIMEEAKKDLQDQNLEIYDLDHSGIVDSYDVRIVKDYANSGLIINPGHTGSGEDRLPWIDITKSWGEGFITGETWHLSIFGCR